MKMERVMGIEPTLSAWEAEVLPLNYTRVCTDPDPLYYVICNRLTSAPRFSIMPIWGINTSFEKIVH